MSGSKPQRPPIARSAGLAALSGALCSACSAQDDAWWREAIFYEVFVRSFYGSHSAVIGLPLFETISLLQGAGYPVYYTWMSAAAAA